MAVRRAVDDPRGRWRVRLHLSAAEDLRGELPDPDRDERAAGAAGQGRGRAGYRDAVCAKEFYETQYRIIQSTAVAQRVADKLGLAHDPDYAALTRRGARRRHVEPGSRARRPGLGEAGQGLRAISQIIVRDTKPERAALLANTFAETYIESNLDYKLEGSRAANAWLSEQEVELRKKLEDSELALFKFKKDRGSARHQSRSTSRT